MKSTHHLISGGLSGFTSAIVLQPFDLVKTRLQQDNSSSSASNNNAKGKGVIKGPANIANVVKSIYRETGIKGLWRGTAATLTRNVPGVALYYTSLQHVRRTTQNLFPVLSETSRHVNSNNGVSTLVVLSPMGNLFAGAMTRTAISAVLNPLTVVKARYESNYYAYKSIPEALTNILREGPRTYFQGFAATALRDAPYAGIFLVAYEGVKANLGPLVTPTSMMGPTIVHTLSGACAATVGTLLTHPFDAIKTRMQVRREGEYRSILSATRAIIQDRGALGLFDGVSLRLSRKVFSSAIGWAIYESSLLLLRR